MNQSSYSNGVPFFNVDSSSKTHTTEALYCQAYPCYIKYYYSNRKKRKIFAVNYQLIPELFSSPLSDEMHVTVPLSRCALGTAAKWLCSAVP